MSFEIRTYGDPVLRSTAAAVDDVDGKVIRLIDGMFETLVESGNGIALAAPQIGVLKRAIVWDLGEGPDALINPEVLEAEGEWLYDEGCLSIPGIYAEILRPKQVLVRGVNLDGEVVEHEADELEARMFLHEIDHLDGVLMFDRMDADQRKQALDEYRRLDEQLAADAAARPERQGVMKRIGLR